MLGPERKLKRPEEHMPPRLCRKLPSMINSAEGQGGEESKDQRATYFTAARVVCTAVAGCDRATHILSTLLRTVCSTYR